MESNNTIKDFGKFKHFRKISPDHLELKIDTDLREAGVYDITAYDKSSKLIFHIRGKKWSVTLVNPENFAYIYDETEQQLLEFSVSTQKIRIILEYLVSIEEEIEFLIHFFSYCTRYEVLK